MNSINLAYNIKNKIILGFWVSLLWFLIGFHQYLSHYSILVKNDCLEDSMESNPFFSGTTLGIILIGALGGTIFVLLWDKWLRNLSFSVSLIYIISLFTFLHIFMTILFVIGLSKEVWEEKGYLSTYETILGELFNTGSLLNFLFWLFICVVTVFVLLVRDKFGPKIFAKFLSGRYFKPRKEERVFMFLDLKSSTTIAENLGEEKYFNFLNDTFKIATPGILATGGEIYQYVGDEIVVSWNIKTGFTKANCIQCFFEIKDSLKNKSDYFNREYGVQPEFKAGLHYGYVIAGEIGMVKREIVYSGDVLNTTSRIQSYYKEVNADILLSEKLLNQLDISKLNKAIKYFDSIMLRGKAEKIRLASLD